MAEILSSKTFTVNGSRVSLAAGVKSGRPVVVLGLQLTTSSPTPDALSFIAIDYPMRSIEGAENFVAYADEAVAIRGKADIEAKFGPAIDMIERAFAPSPPTPTFHRKDPFEGR